MKVLESKFKNVIIEIIVLPQGKVFVFSDFIITEFDEGITVDLECFLAIFQILDTYSNNKSQFGFISNRVNSYSLKTEDFLGICHLAARKHKSAMVVHNEQIARTTAFEQQIFKCDTEIFTCLEKAVSWMDSTGPIGVAS